MGYCPTLRHYFVSNDVAFFETTLFSLSSTVTGLGKDDDLLVYTFSSPVPTSRAGKSGGRIGLGRAYIGPKE